MNQKNNAETFEQGEMSGLSENFFSASQIIRLKHAFFLIAHLTDLADRLTVRQFLAFLYFAHRDVLGEPKSLNDLRRQPGFINMLTRSLEIFLVQKAGSKNESLGWLYREFAPDDKRKILIRLTPKGVEVCQQIISMLG